MDELLLEHMMNDGVSDAKKNTKSGEEGFKSLVPSEEVKHWEDMVNDLQKYVERVHIPNILSLKDGAAFTAKQRVHFLLYLDLVTDLVKILNRLKDFNETGVKALEEIHSKEGIPYERMEINLFLNKVFSGK